MRSDSAAAIIASGLALLVAAACWPAAPAVTAMALVALGATSLTLPRLVHQQNAPILIAAHLFVYVSLYLLFVGAVWHGATAGPRAGWHLWQSLDLLASLWPMALASRLAVTAILALGRGEDATLR
ncbi:MAG: hypothetical protein WD669_08745 [Pirellulales bacterium]